MTEHTVHPMPRIAAAEAAKTRKGAARKDQILSAALETLAREGAENLTLDGIAREVGISKGNLQYYFPARSDLLRAAFIEHIAKHKSRWSAVYDRVAAGPGERMMRLVAFELEMNRDPIFVAQVREKWTLVGRDEETRRLSEDWNSWVTEHYAQVVAEMRPDLDSPTCRQLAIIIYSLLVGAIPFCAAADSALNARIEQSVLDMIDAA